MNLKKFLFLVIVLITVFALIACNSDDNNNDNNQNGDNTSDNNNNNDNNNNDNNNDNTGDNTGDPEKVYYTVTFDFAGILQQRIEKDGKATAPREPEKNGYTFDGWMLGDAAWSFDTPVTSDITLTPSFTATVYTITYMDGDTVLDFSPTTYTIESEDIILASNSKEHYNFMGWYKDAEFTQNLQKIEKGSFGNITLYAQFTVKNYGITYELGGGVNHDGNPRSYNIDTTFPVLLAAPTREGYNFLGWYTDPAFENEFTGIESLCGNVIVFAKWEKADDPGTGGGTDEPPIIVNKEYTITYYDGTEVLKLEPEKYTSGTPLALPTYEKANYHFAGWYTTETFEVDTNVASITEATTGNLVLYAKFVPFTYTITYMLDGGVNNEANPDTYTVDDKDFAFATPTKEGHKFAGWFTTPDYTKQISTLRGKAEHLVLYAKWEQEGSSGNTLPEDKFN